MEEKERGATGKVSRRSFIATAGLVAVAGGVLAGEAISASPREPPAKEPPAKEPPAKEPPAKTPAAGEWPWVKLDPQEAAERAFRNYHAKGG
jgi:hypothetical protein